MAVKTIRCPKCSHEQRGGKECEACGVIFSRYRQVQERQQQQQAADDIARSRQRKRLWSVVQSLALVLLTAGSTYYFVADQKDSASPLPAAPAVVSVQQTPRPEPGLAAAPKPAAPEQANVAAGPMTIEEARKATVSIETPWGTGSGFFVTDNFIVTNRHVVKMEESQLADFRHKVKTTRDLVELEKQKIRDLRARLNETQHEATRKQIRIIIDESERNLNTIMPQLEEAERRLAKLEQKPQADDIRIILADGSTHYANFLLISDRHDLAIMSLYVHDVKYLRRPPQSQRIQQGDKVFTIGSPVGLRNTVTAGVFSGYRKDTDNDSLYLQTDAPINPGNSGGPLIDENGYVRGVNTMILQNTEGIGFAIPIETVFEEFGSSLH